MSRRNFLKQIGLAAATIGIAPISQAAVTPFRSLKSDLKIGLLLPENKGYQHLADHYLTGFKSILLSRNPGEKLSGIHTEHYCISGNDFYKKIKSLLLESDVDIVVAHASNHLISSVMNLFDKTEKFLLASVLGENIGISLPVSPFVYINSLNLWQSNWLAGRWVASRTVEKVAIVNSFYDAGFDSSSTFKNGFENGGGQQIKNFMFDPPGIKTDPQSVISEIEQYAPSTIFVNLSGNEANAFLKVFLNSGMNENVELVASPLALTEQALPHLGAGCCGIKSVFTWSPRLENKANLEFLSLLQDKKVENPDIFHLLGYETAMMILDAEKRVGSTGFNTHSFSLALESLTIEGPRGLVKMDNMSHTSSAPYYLREVTVSKFKFVNMVVTDQLAAIDEKEESIRREHSGLASGWINPYLTT